ncbi:MAG TPA: serine/threonine-protein kinase [Kofleriaceae bacterium]
MVIAAGSRIGKYVVERRLGAGGMAEVFLAYATGAEGFARRFAIKRILGGDANENHVRLFTSEALITSKLEHEHIVSVVDFDRDAADGGLFLVMEYVDGVDLDALRASGPIPVPVSIVIIADVLRALAYAHSAPITNDGRTGVVHRDISPHNVLISWRGIAKVSDFGIAKLRDASASIHIVGKPSYMSPEQVKAEKLDGRSDLFAVGVVLWELLVGTPLFRGSDYREVLSSVMFQHIDTPRACNSSVPSDVSRIVMRLLERDPAKRYANAREALTDLAATDSYPRDGRELLADFLLERVPGRAPARATRGPTRVTAPESPVTRRSRRRGLALAALAFGGVASTAGIFIITSSTDSQAESPHAPTRADAAPAPASQVSTTPPVEPPSPPDATTTSAPAAVPEAPAPDPVRHVAAPTKAAKSTPSGFRVQQWPEQH